MRAVQQVTKYGDKTSGGSPAIQSRGEGECEQETDRVKVITMSCEVAPNRAICPANQSQSDPSSSCSSVSLKPDILSCIFCVYPAYIEMPGFCCSLNSLCPAGL